MKNKHTNILTALTLLFLISLVAITTSEDSYAEHSLNLSTASAQTIDVSSNGTGTTISGAEINVTTTCSAGYNLSFSTTVSDNNLYLDGNPSNNIPGKFFSPSDGTTSLINANDTWGYYFSTPDGEIPTANNIFSAVPTFDNPVTLRSPAQTASDTSIDDSFIMYYGVKVSSNTRSGQYYMVNDEHDTTGTIVYYATLPEDCFRYAIEYNPTSTSTGTSISGTGNIEKQYATEGETVNLTSETFEAPTLDGILYYFVGWNTMQDGTGVWYDSGDSVTNLAPTGNTIILYAQWANCPRESICYDKNPTESSGKMGPQSAISNTKTDLLAPNYSLQGYGFIGWSEDEDATTKLASDEAVTIYGPNETILTNDLSRGGMYLYAVWLEATETLQEWDGCDGLDVGNVIALQDARDDNAYGVAKLADGRCWMIENLRLESESSTNEKAAFAQGYNASFTGLADPEYNNFDNSAASNSLYNTSGTTGNLVYGDNIGSRFPRYNNTNTLPNDIATTQADDSIHNYGNYYTWTAAIADTTASFDTNTVVETTSICPSNWHLPRGGNKDIEANNDYWELIVNGINGGAKPNNYDSFPRPYYYGSTEGASMVELLKKFPNNLLQSGYYSGTSASSRGSVGRYWTSVASVNNGAYLFSIEPNRVDPGTAFYPKYHGYSIRCVFAGD